MCAWSAPMQSSEQTSTPTALRASARIVQKMVLRNQYPVLGAGASPHETAEALGSFSRFDHLSLHKSKPELVVDADENAALDCPTSLTFITQTETKASPPVDDDIIL